MALTADRFTNGNQVLGMASTVAYFDGPLGHLMLFKGGETFRFYLKGRHQQGVAVTGGDVVIDLRAAGHSLMQSPRSGAAFPNKYHPDVLAYTSANGGATWTAATIKAVDWATGKVTVTTPAGSSQVAVYFLTGDGEFELRVVRPLGSDVVSAKLFGGACRSIHETDQTNARSAPSFGGVGQEYPLPPQFRFEISVRSKTPIVFDKYAYHEISLPLYDTPIRVLDAAQMNAQAEVKLRGNSI